MGRHHPYLKNSQTLWWIFPREKKDRGPTLLGSSRGIPRSYNEAKIHNGVLDRKTP